MMNSTKGDCSYCGIPFSYKLSQCPVCGEQAFPNVRLADRQEERDELERRYQEALSDAESRGCKDAVLAFEREIAVRSKAITNNKSRIVFDKSISDNELYASYYERIEGGSRIPDDDNWDFFRRITDETIFPYFKSDIHFAALTLDGEGLPNYGDCSIVFRDNMIDRRTSVIECNSVMLIIKIWDELKKNCGLPFGYRTVWEDRAKLCIAKLSGKINSDIDPGDYPKLLLTSDKDRTKDEFVEIHIYGKISRYTLERVIIQKSSRPPDEDIINKLKEKLSEIGVKVEER
jgi:hypothetical protein